MPLYDNARNLIRRNLEDLAQGSLKPKGVFIGTLTPTQLGAINAERAARTNPFPPIVAEILFYGKHLFNSRIRDDGYTIEDVLDQVESALGANAAVIPSQKMTAIQNHGGRADRYNNLVKDMAVFECTSRHPHPELLSVIPKGDKNKPAK